MKLPWWVTLGIVVVTACGEQVNRRGGNSEEAKKESEDAFGLTERERVHGSNRGVVVLEGGEYAILTFNREYGSFFVPKLVISDCQPDGPASVAGVAPFRFHPNKRCLGSLSEFQLEGRKFTPYGTSPNLRFYLNTTDDSGYLEPYLNENHTVDEVVFVSWEGSETRLALGVDTDFGIGARETFTAAPEPTAIATNDGDLTSTPDSTMTPTAVDESTNTNTASPPPSDSPSTSGTSSSTSGSYSSGGSTPTEPDLTMDTTPTPVSTTDGFVPIDQGTGPEGSDNWTLEQWLDHVEEKYPYQGITVEMDHVYIAVEGTGEPIFVPGYRANCGGAQTRLRYNIPTDFIGGDQPCTIELQQFKLGDRSYVVKNRNQPLSFQLAYTDNGLSMQAIGPAVTFIEYRSPPPAEGEDPLGEITLSGHPQHGFHFEEILATDLLPESFIPWQSFDTRPSQPVESDGATYLGNMSGSIFDAGVRNNLTLLANRAQSATTNSSSSSQPDFSIHLTTLDEYVGADQGIFEEENLANHKFIYVKAKNGTGIKDMFLLSFPDPDYSPSAINHQTFEEGVTNWEFIHRSNVLDDVCRISYNTSHAMARLTDADFRNRIRPSVHEPNESGNIALSLSFSKLYHGKYIICKTLCEEDDEGKCSGGKIKYRGEFLRFGKLRVEYGECKPFGHLECIPANLPTNLIYDYTGRIKLLSSWDQETEIKPLKRDDFFDGETVYIEAPPDTKHAEFDSWAGSNCPCTGPSCAAVINANQPTDCRYVNKLKPIPHVAFTIVCDDCIYPPTHHHEYGTSEERYASWPLFHTPLAQLNDWFSNLQVTEKQVWRTDEGAENTIEVQTQTLRTLFGQITSYSCESYGRLVIKSWDGDCSACPINGSNCAFTPTSKISECTVTLKHTEDCS